MDNEQIVLYLDEYLTSVSQKFAVLIDGERGSGKTPFIREVYLKRTLTDGKT